MKANYHSEQKKYYSRNLESLFIIQMSRKIYEISHFFFSSLLRLEPADMNKMALECFASIMRYMGDLGLLKNQHEVDCVNTILM